MTTIAAEPDTTVDAVTPAILTYLDPRTLTANTANIRSELGDLALFLGSARYPNTI